MTRFCCDLCGETKDADTSDEDAYARAVAIYGEIAEEDRGIICADCYDEGVARGLLRAELTEH